MKRGFTLIELLVVVAITLLICSMATMTFDGLQRAISISRRGLDSVSEAEFLLQIIQRDLRNSVDSNLSEPILREVGKKKTDYFLSNLKGYEGDRHVSLLGYSLDRDSSGSKLYRYSRSIGWDNSIFGTTLQAHDNALDSAAVGLKNDFFENEGDEISRNVVDIAFYYHYLDKKNHTISISRKPIKGELPLHAITVSLLISNLYTQGSGEGIDWERIEGQIQNVYLRKELDRDPLPWMERFDRAHQELTKLKGPRVNIDHFYRTIEVGQ
ncbi:MAG: type II secretion system protein [Verrucomicrobiota bacterium]